ncbi:MAG TPA: hypothetical protein VMS77_06175 [Conexivisphaerales archaeon]|nr:hypothetical protein [Conexivisphaerales archaeon]
MVDADIVEAIDVPAEFSGLVRRHYDRILLDDSLSDLEAVLFSLNLAEFKAGTSGADYAECKRIFIGLGRREENFKVNIYLAKKKSLLVAKGDVLEFTVHGLRALEKVLGKDHRAPVFLIKSDEAFSAIKHFEEFLASDAKAADVSLCDPYVSPSTLFPFSALKGDLKTLRILTANIFDSEKFGEYRKKFEKEMKLVVEVRKSRHIHDRYLLAHGKCWSIGSSIKDLGNKDTIIKEITEVAESMSDLFSKRWAEAGEEGEST